MLSKLLGGSLVDTVGKVIDSVHTSEEEKLAARNKLKELENEINSKQMDINLADAKSTATGIGGIMQRSWSATILETTNRNELCSCNLLGVCR
jgi:hypothetical protein